MASRGACKRAGDEFVVLWVRFFIFWEKLVFVL